MFNLTKHNFARKKTVQSLPLLLIVAVIGIISFLLISSTLPSGQGLFGKLFPKQASHAAAVPGGFMETAISSPLVNPTAMAFAPDGRIFVTLQNGALRIVKNMGLFANPFMNISVDSNGERGLLGVAFDPQFNTNHFIYVYYTATTPATHNRVSRFTASGDLVAPGSEAILFDIDNLSSATNHNGGAIHFGQDGKLYIGVGDNANSANSQIVTNLLGKVLRLNSDGTIPADNPTSFISSTGTTLTPTGKNRAIYAIGFRNPFTFDVQPGTGRMFVNDVGDAATARREEINDLSAGKNYGWPTCQGGLINGTSNDCTNPQLTNPLYSYPPGSDGNCAITGGAFYNPATTLFPSQYVGSYFFADYCAGWIKQFNPTNSQVTNFVASGISNPVDLKVGADGALYYLARGSSTLVQISYMAAPVPTPTPGIKVGDLDGDGDIDIFDYSTLVTNFGRTGANLVGDLDHDGDIDIFDYSTLVTNFGH